MTYPFYSIAMLCAQYYYWYRDAFITSIAFSCTITMIKNTPKTQCWTKATHLQLKTVLATNIAISCLCLLYFALFSLFCVLLLVSMDFCCRRFKKHANAKKWTIIPLIVCSCAHFLTHREIIFTTKCMLRTLQATINF